MSKYDIYRTSVEDEYLLDVQTDLLAPQITRVVIPVLPADRAPLFIKTLHVKLSIDEKPFVIITPLIAAVPTAVLKPSIGTYAHLADDMTRALDFLFQGY
ncbi:CcdB family protein [uncultured Sulfitobacter sp.]|uniref:CcdB family protein n=1 Tax=uncultured Sulfitobacter sp. TaxID=191468 RepID=UPI0026127E14|nr:CcdB family protein [uncultured Sulfitobacter sp.]